MLFDFFAHALTFLPAFSITASTPTLTPTPRKVHDLAPALTPPTPPSTPPPTSRKRHDSMNSAKMNANNVQVVQQQQAPSPKAAHVLNPNTGFSEPFSHDRNTTLPHPDADTSQHATIEGAQLELTHSNSKRRFLHSRHHSQKSIAHGVLDPSGFLHDKGGHYEEKQKAAVAARKAEHDVGLEREANGVGVQNEGEKGEEELVVQDERDEQGYHEGERRKGVLRKLHLHKV